MCGRRSRIGLRGIAIGSFLLLLAASPCFSAASWAGILSGDTGTSTATELAKEYSEEYLGEFSAQESTTPSETSGSDSLKELATQLGNLRAEQEILSKKASDLKSLSQDLNTRLENYSMTGEITEAEYQAVKASLLGLTEVNGKQADEIALLQGKIATLETKLEEATGSKAYLMLSGLVGFDGLIPQFGAGLTLGTRIGEHAMLEAGADYDIGGLDGYNTFSFDNFSFRLGLGWMF